MISSCYLLIKNGTKGEKGEPGQIVNVVINFLLDLYVLVPNILQIFFKNSYSIFFIFGAGTCSTQRSPKMVNLHFYIRLHLHLHFFIYQITN